MLSPLLTSNLLKTIKTNNNDVSKINDCDITDNSDGITDNCDGRLVIILKTTMIVGDDDDDDDDDDDNDTSDEMMLMIMIVMKIPLYNTSVSVYNS